MPTKKRRGFSTDYLSPAIDIFSLLHALHTHANSGIRDYLVHRLYDMSDLDIDFCLPQLMCLLLSWDVNRSYRLQEFVIAKCSQSIHLSLKVLWILQAAEYYSRREDERHRVRDLIHSCEMSLVNASIFGEGEHTTDGQPANNKSQARINREKKRLHIMNSNFYATQQERRRLASPTHSTSQATGGHTDAHSPASPERPFIFGTATDAYTARIFSPVNGGTGNFSFNQPSTTNNDTNASTSTDVAKPPHLTPHKSIPVSVEEIYFALSKKVKCEYFNLELQLIHQLILISSHLVKFPPPARKQKLRRMLSTLPSVHTDNLYLPSNIPNARHYRILRLLGQEAVSLSSRDKAPYLLYFEIEYTNHSSCYDYDIYTAYRSNEEIMEESMELIEEATQQPWGEEGTHADITMADGTNPAPTPAQAAAEPVNNGPASTATTAKPTDKDSHRPPPLNTAAVTPAKAANSTHSTHSMHSTQHDTNDHHSTHTSLSNRRLSLSRPLDPSKPAVQQIQQQTVEEQQEGIQRVFQDMDTAQTEKASVANVLSTAASSAIGRSNNHPGSALGEVAQAEREQEDEAETAQQQRLIRIRALPQPDPIVSPTKANHGPLFRVTSASQPPSQPPSQPDSPTHDLLGSSVPRAGHLSSLTELLEKEGLEEKEDVYGEARARMDMAALDIARARTQGEKDAEFASASAGSPPDMDSVSITVSPESTSSTPSPLLSPSSEGRAEPSGNLLVAAAKKMSHAVSSPDLQVQKEEDTVDESVDKDNDTKKEKSATIHEKKSVKHAVKEGGNKQRSFSSGITSLSSTTPSSHTTPASTGRPSLQPTAEPAYMRNPAWQKLDTAFGDRWDARKRRVFAASPNQHLERWDLLSCIFKSGDDCRQEVLAMQLIMLFDHIWREAKLPLWLRPYSVLITSPTSGLIETIQDATSVDALKKSMMAVDPYASLSSFFHLYFGMQGNDRHVEAVRNFAESMAGYSVICYLLQIKDRHNGNIMLDREGHVIHIDYGFMLSNSPGRNWGWEQSPFKLTSEYITVMTIDSHHSFFPYFRTLVVQGYMEARKHWHVIHLLIQLMMRAQSLPCFAGAGEAGTLQQLRQRFMVDATDEEALQHAMSLIDQSIDNWRTHQYDRFQRMTNGIV